MSYIWNVPRDIMTFNIDTTFYLPILEKNINQ